MKNFEAGGNNIDLIAPSGGVTSGTPAVIGDLLVFPVADADEGDKFAAMVNGVFSVTKPGSQAWSEGTAIYYDATNSLFTNVASSHKKVGVAAGAVAGGAGDTTGFIRLNGTALTSGFAIPEFSDGTKIVAVGDSITQAGHYSDVSYTKISNQGDSFMNWALMNVPGFQFLTYFDAGATEGSAYFRGANFGVQGDTASGISDRLTPVINTGADVAVILAGTNEGVDNTLASAVISDLGDILTTLAAASVHVVLGTIWPRETRTTPTPPEVSPAYMQRILDINAWIRTQASATVTIWDPWDDLIDPQYTYGVDDEYGSPLAGMLRDDVHPAPLGSYTAAQSLKAILGQMTGTDLDTDTWFNSDPTDAANIILDGDMDGSGGTANNGVTGTVADNFVAGYVVAPTYCSGVASVENNNLTGGQNSIFVLSSDGLGSATGFEQFGFTPLGFRINEAALSDGDWVQFFVKVEVTDNTEGVLGALRCQLRNSTANKYAHGLEHTNGTRQLEPWPTGDFEGWIISEPLQYNTADQFIPHLYADMLENVAGDVQVKVEKIMLLPVADPDVTFPYTT